MMLSGKRFWVLLVLALWLAPVQAALEVAVDRQQVALGDSLRLVITATANEDLDALDLRRLLADFEVLQRSKTSSTSIINGQRTQTRQLLLDLSPRRQGLLAIPGLRIGASTSEPIAIEVGPPPEPTDSEETVVVTAEVDRDAVYVQGQLLLTVRIQQAINLDSRSVSELQLDNAYVQPLEQNSFQRTIDGRPWLVHEIRYAIFPEQSGTLVIPAQVFSGRESAGRRSVFDFGTGGRQIQRRTEPVTVRVLPRPSGFPADATWLPASNLSIEESWSTAPETLQVGESVTRTITLSGEGLQGAQLPPVTFTIQDGLRYYPDQPDVGDSESGSGLVGQRRDSAALVASRAGDFTLPELRIPWWDVEQEVLRFAVVPERRITIAAAATSRGAQASAVPADATSPQALPSNASTSAAAQGLLWQSLAVVFATLWLATVFLLWRRRPVSTPQAEPDPRAAGSETRAFKHLQAACASDSAAAARVALIDWARTVLGADRPIRTADIARQFGDPTLTQAIADLEEALYRRGANPWRGTELAAAVTALRRQQPGGKNGSHSAFPLYPAAKPAR